MRNILILGLALLFSCGQRDAKDPVDYHDRFDLDNTVDTTKGTYNPRVDSTYIFPADSSDIITTTDYGDYKIVTTIFPVRNKYLILFESYVDDKPKIRGSKVKLRDYKFQVDITDRKGLHVKKVITKYDFPDSILKPEPKYYFIREVKFIGFTSAEFRFDIKIASQKSDEPSAMIKYFVHLADGARFENYPKSYYDSLYFSTR
jgi:hypothetical protein